jgi:hypothetical protein
MSVRRALAIVQVAAAVVFVDMAHQAAVRHDVGVLVRMGWLRVALVLVAVVMQVIVVRAMAMGSLVHVVVPVRGAIGMGVLVHVCLCMIMRMVVRMVVPGIVRVRMPVHRAIGMRVLMLVRIALDAGFAAAAAAGRAHVRPPLAFWRRLRRLRLP